MAPLPVQAQVLGDFVINLVPIDTADILFIAAGTFTDLHEEQRGQSAGFLGEAQAARSEATLAMLSSWIAGWFGTCRILHTTHAASRRTAIATASSTSREKSDEGSGLP